MRTSKRQVMLIKLETIQEVVPPEPKRPPPQLPVAEEDDITKQLADFQKKTDTYIKEHGEVSGGATTASTEEQKTGGAPTNRSKSIYERFKDEHESLEDLHERRILRGKRRQKMEENFYPMKKGSHGAHNATMCPTDQRKVS